MDVGQWITVVVAVLGVALLFSDLIINIKKHHNRKVNIIGLVFLSLSLACFIPTIVFGEESPVLLNFAWIGFLIGYFVCDVILAVCLGKSNAALKKQKKAEQQAENEDSEAPEESAEETSDENDADNSDGE